MKLTILLLIALMMFAIVANATSPVLVQGSPTCGSIGFSRAVMNNYVLTGTYDYDVSGVGSLSIKVRQMGHFNYQSTPSFVRAVILKGGPNANVYYYPTGGNFDFEITTPADGRGNSYLLSYYEVCYAAAPTAANVGVSGKVVAQGGGGIPRAIVTLTDSVGNTKTASTNSFGNFHFEDCPVGQLYTVLIVAKGYSFQPLVFDLSDELTDLNIINLN